jgi:amino acid transporter
MAESPEELDTTQRIKELLLGKPKELKDPGLFHRIALVAFLAWVGLGADGLSSSAYGPEEAFRALGEHRWLAIFLALATTVTVFVISWGESKIIEAFPSGGGGYVVSFKILGPLAGAVAGSALVIDMVLTIAISIASGMDAIFSYLPTEWHAWKISIATLVIVALVVVNLRGVKESVSVLAPIFMLFLLTHAIILVTAVVQNMGNVPAVVATSVEQARTGAATIGIGGLVLVFLRAYSMGGGTYTGIEAVANGMNIMRAPVVETAKRTLLYMSVSLALTASGILLCYLLLDVRHVEGRTMNAVLVDRVASGWQLGGIPFGKAFAVVTLLSEAALLFVAAQAGFIDGPRVMSNMAVDSWLPHRFAALSDRLTMRNGILLMTAAALLAIWYTGGDVRHLVVLYAINVFVTFSVSNIAMLRRSRVASDYAVHGLAALMCLGILGVTVYEKFGEGGWITLGLTGCLLGVCILIRRHYLAVRHRLRRLDLDLATLPAAAHAAPPFDPAS